LALAPATQPAQAEPLAEAPTPASALPGLTGLLMRRAGWVATAVLAFALVLGLLGMSRDMEDEARAALGLAQKLAAVAAVAASAPDDASALAALQAQTQAVRTGHLQLQVHTATGQPLLLDAPPAQPAAPLAALLQLHRALTGERPPQSVRWPLPRPHSPPWVLTLVASPEAEREEAMASLLLMLATMLLCVAGLLLALRWNLRRALAPLGQLLRAMARIEQRDTSAVQALPPMPVAELEAVARALRHLSAALHAAEAQRRVLGQRVITLQEDERARLGRELHDEFGQHLTALRVDAAWLARQPWAQGTAGEVLEGLQQHIRQIQQVLRSVLTRLRPLGPSGPDAALPGATAASVEDTPFTLERLAQLLQGLVDSWHGRPGTGLQARLLLGSVPQGHPPAAEPGPWPADAAAQPLPAALGLAIYRITQEALTNIARHAQASEARVQLLLQPGTALHWAVQDDGIGLPATADALWHGNGLGGIQERVWALGADLQLQAAYPGRPRSGLRLQAVLPWAVPAAAGAAQP
jgi:two-component system sensor histidine kinase UhpB